MTFFIFTYLALLSYASAGPLCIICSYAISPDVCEQVVRCRDNEDCYIQQFVTPGGHVLYDLGCKDKNSCQVLDHGPKTVGRRKVDVKDKKEVGPFEIVDVEEQTDGQTEDNADGRRVTCELCCNSGDLCNNGGLCGTKAYNKHGGRLCFHCEQQFLTDDCDRITLCSQDRFCQITQTHTDTSSFVFFRTGCADRLDCMQTSKASFATRCNSCCQDDLCNDKCTLPNHPPTPPTTPTTTTTTTTTTTPAPLTAPNVITIAKDPPSPQPGDRVVLTCIVTGNPIPNVAWELIVAPDKVPNNVNADRQHPDKLVIDRLNPASEIPYRCWAKNSEGMDSRTINL